MMNSKTELKEIIQNNVVTVVFTKVDGTERAMKCTLLPEYLPQKQQDNVQLLQESLSRLENPNTLSVWDLDNNAWRSFRCDSVQKIQMMTLE
jgi:hypothetical protein